MPAFAPNNMTALNAPAPFVVSASTTYSGFPAYWAFNNNPGQYWIATTSTGWLQIFVSTPRILIDYAVQVNTIPEPNRAPKDWTMQGSNDGTNFVVLHTVTGQTAWGSGETRTFYCAPSIHAYTYFRINVTLNNGDGLLEIAELYLSHSASANYLHGRGHNRLDLRNITRLHV